MFSLTRLAGTWYTELYYNGIFFSASGRTASIAIGLILQDVAATEFVEC